MDSYVLIIVAAYGTPIFKCAIKDNFPAKLNQIISFKSIIHSPIISHFDLSGISLLADQSQQCMKCFFSEHIPCHIL